jgi:hypothetical protein
VERAAALLIALSLQLLFLLRLLRVSHHSVVADNLGHMQLRVLVRPVPPVPAVQSAPARADLPRSPLPSRPATASTIDTTAAAVAASTASSRGRLNLSLPPGTAAVSVLPSRQPWERPPAVDYRATRFNQNWAPDGGDIHKTWAFRSKLAGVVLMMTGALITACSQEERDLRLAKCFGAQYEGDVEPPPDPNNK